jgi:hypothetical protein
MLKIKNLRFIGFENRIVYLVLNLFAALNFIFIILQFERYENNSEKWDLLLFLLLGTITISFCLVYMFNNEILFKTNYLIIFFAFYGLFKGVSTIEFRILEIWDKPFSHYLWSGFGWQVILVSFLFTFFIYNFLFSESKLNTFLRLLLGIYLILSALLAYWQNTNSLIDVTHSNHVFNELFAVKNSKIHFSSFIPQYQSLYTFLGIFIKNKTTEDFLDAQLLVMFLTTLLTIFICLKFVKDSNSKLNYLTSILLTVPFLVVAPIFYLRQSDLGTMATLLSSFPIRLFPSIVLIYLCLSSIKFVKDKISFNKTVLSATGLLAGLNIWNNYEFALVIIVSILGLVFLLHIEDKKIKLKKLIPPSLIFIINSIIGYSIIPIFYNFRNIDLNFSYLGWWTRQFAQGFGNTRILIPGPSMFVLSMMFVLFAIHFYFLYNYKHYPEKTAESIRKNSSTGLIISIFCILGSPYYLNRSYASGQLQIFLFFISVSFAILIGTFLTTSGSSKKYSFNSIVSLKNSLVNLFFMTLLATFVSSVVISSTPYYEYKRIASTVENPNWPDSNFSKIFDEVEEYYTFNNILPEEIGYFGDFSEIVEYKTGVKSLMFITGAIDVVNFQDSFDYQKNVYKQSCDIVKQFDSELIIIDKLTYERQRLSENNFCESYYVYDSYDAIKVLKKISS